MAKKPTTRFKSQQLVPPIRGIYFITFSSGATCYRVQLSGKKVGGRRLSTYCETLEEAKQIKAEWLAGGGPPDLPPGGEPAPTPPQEPAGTVRAGINLYAADLRQKDQTHAAVRAGQVVGVLEKLSPAILNLPLHQLALPHIYEFRSKRKKAGIKANTIRRDLGVLRQVLKLAGCELKIPESALPPANNTRVRMLTPQDWRQAVLALPEPFRTMVKLAALCLMRQGDIRQLTRAMVDLHTATVTLPETKTGPRQVTLGAEALELLRDALKRSPHASLVFPAPSGKPYSAVHVSRVWLRVARKLGLHDFTFHDLKHHGAMKALHNNATFPDLQQLGGWKTPAMVNRYASPTADRIRDLQNRMTEQQAEPAVKPVRRRRSSS